MWQRFTNSWELIKASAAVLRADKELIVFPMILRWLSERGGAIGRLVIGLLGLAWNVATYLVVPVLVVEGVGPVAAAVYHYAADGETGDFFRGDLVRNAFRAKS